jgi:SAM-dependent methyltransferase
MALTKYIVENITGTGLEFKDFFTQMSEDHGVFEDHISKSIPSYKQMSIETARAVAKVYDKAICLDIGSSEGYWGDEVVKNNSEIIVHSLDPNWKMKEVFMKKHERNSDFKNNKFLQYSFGEGFHDEQENKTYKGYKPINKYDIVRESMTFQFLSTDRESQYKLCKRALKPNGLFITNSKNHLPDKDEYKKYEDLKDEFKRKHFTDQQIEKKAKEILPNMSKYMVSIIDTFDALENYFKYVVQYWVSGNFHGFLASDDADIVNKMLSQLPLPNGYPDSVEGKLIDPEIIFNLKK